MVLPLGDSNRQSKGQVVFIMPKESVVSGVWKLRATSSRQDLDAIPSKLWTKCCSW